MMEDIKRLPAYKLKVSDLLDGAFVREEGWQPSYLLTKRGLKASRINLIAAVIGKQEEDTFRNIVVDDGSSSIAVRSFTEQDYFSNIELGDMVMIVGRIREYGAERYITPEIVKKLADPKWAELRLLELKLADLEHPAVQAEPLEKKESPIAARPAEPVMNSRHKAVFELVKSLDSGKGVSIEEVSARLGSSDVERIVKALLEEGELFEVRPGTLKVLE
jgi:RPA family protein